MTKTLLCISHKKILPPLSDDLCLKRRSRHRRSLSLCPPLNPIANPKKPPISPPFSEKELHSVFCADTFFLEYKNAAPQLVKSLKKQKIKVVPKMHTFDDFSQ